MRLFRALFVIDALAALALVYFFVDGLRSATNSDYVTVWVPLLVVPIGILIAAPLLRQRGHQAAATMLLALLAIPPVLFALFFGLLLVLQPRWN